jgi:Tol biopolymer transport system component/DNA-binding winged helix-turn-helix (wHTH) protein
VPPTLAPRVVRFGVFEIDLSSGELRKHGLRVRIQQQPYQVLSALLERPGELVTRDELVRRLWPEGTYVDFDRSLNSAVTRLRQTLSDSAESPRYIETVARHGYRLLTSVDIVSEARAADPPEAAAEPPLERQSPAPQRGKRRFAAYGATAVVLLVAGLLLIGRPSAPPEGGVRYTQITDLVDSAVAPALSPDGRTVAFIRGSDWFLSPGQIWLKALPDGEPVQLTRDARVKFAPAFSPDGSTLAYSVVEPSTTAWDTMVAPILGGEPRMLLSNAEGLTWLSPDTLLFSEIKKGIHMGVVTSGANKSAARDVYLPAHERGMAHFSYASPDRKWVLVIEMDHTTAFGPCRLVPFDGSSQGRPVGPPGRCTAAGWSPDGKWMYFTAGKGSDQHLWRQRFPGGEPEQVTSGPAEAQGVAVAPDGRSVITSLGMRQSAIWVHDSGGDRPISSMGVASSPKFSLDGSRVFYLLRRDALDSPSELWSTELSTGKSRRLVGGRQITSYDISRNGSEAVLAVTPPEGKSEIWLALLDGRASPVRIASDGEDSPFFGADQILFRQSDGKASYLLRMNRDGSGRRKVTPNSILTVMSASPDGMWVAALVAVQDGASTFAEVAIPTAGGEPKRICSGFCLAGWAPDMRHLYVTLNMRRAGQTLAIPVPEGKGLPDLPAGGLRSVDEGVKLSDDLAIEEGQLAPGLSPSVYAYVKTTMHRNLFRVPVR